MSLYQFNLKIIEKNVTVVLYVLKISRIQLINTFAIFF